MRHIHYIFLSILVFAIVGCTTQERYFPNDLPDVQLPIQRFDQALLSVDTTNIPYDIQQLYQDFPVFMPYFTENIIGIPAMDTTYLAEVLPNFLYDTVYGFKQTNEQVRITFADIADIQQPLNAAFARLTYLYPTITLPTITFFVSGFNASILYFEEETPQPITHIAVGVDMYLGSDYEYYNRVVYNYQKHMMRKECIPADIVSTYLFHHFPYTSTKSRLLENMIYRGKILYVLSLLFPGESRGEIIGYTSSQIKWAEYYEAEIWKMMMDKKDIFSTEPMVLTSYLNDGPFTSEISQESPARLGIWIGMRICESYMKNNPHVTIQELLQEGDAQKILEESLYKP